MAVVPSSQVAPLTGLALPAIASAGGYFVSKTGDDIAWGDLIVAMFTPAGSRPMARTFGSSLTQVVFQPNSAMLAQQVDYIIKEVVARCAPTVRVVSTQCTQAGNTFGIVVQFQKSGDPSVTQSPAISISKSSVVNYLAAARAQAQQ